MPYTAQEYTDLQRKLAQAYAAIDQGSINPSNDVLNYYVDPRNRAQRFPGLAPEKALEAYVGMQNLAKDNAPNNNYVLPRGSPATDRAAYDQLIANLGSPFAGPPAGSTAKPISRDEQSKLDLASVLDSINSYTEPLGGSGYNDQVQEQPAALQRSAINNMINEYAALPVAGPQQAAAAPAGANVSAPTASYLAKQEAAPMQPIVPVTPDMEDSLRSAWRNRRIMGFLRGEDIAPYEVWRDEAIASMAGNRAATQGAPYAVEKARLGNLGAAAGIDNTQAVTAGENLTNVRRSAELPYVAPVAEATLTGQRAQNAAQVAQNMFNDQMNQYKLALAKTDTDYARLLNQAQLEREQAAKETNLAQRNAFLARANAYEQQANRYASETLLTKLKTAWAEKNPAQAFGKDALLQALLGGGQQQQPAAAQTLAPEDMDAMVP